MKTLLTAEVSEDHIAELKKLLDIQYEGWYKSKKILTEDEMTELIKGKEILITSYDPVTKKVMDASPELKLIV